RTGDPWFALLAVEQRANVALAAWDVARAEAVLRAAAGRCGEPGAIAFRCQRLTRLQTQVYLMMHRAKAAQEAWAKSRQLATAGGMPPQEDELLRFAGQIALIRDGTAASLHALTRAYFEEWGASGGTCAQVHDAREVVAQSLINQHRLDEARAHLLAPAPCEAPPGVRRAFLLGQLLRPGDTAAAEALRRELEALRADPARPAGERIVYDHVEGRALLAVDPGRGRAKLRAVIDAARGEAPLAALARSFSYAVLVQDAGQRGAWDEALALLAEERGARPPERCAFGASVETAAVFVARGADGGLAGVHVPLAVGQAPGEARVPAELPRRLEGCPVVDVYARQPYYGRPDLLPPALAVRFRASRPAGAGAGEPARPAAGPVVVVGNVVPPPELGLATLQPIGAPEGATLIEGAQATPDRVLAAMRTAGFVALHSHGLVGIAEDDAAMLVLSPDPGGRYALTASEVAGARLSARPVVVLAACEAAVVGSAFHAAWGLADAFLEAGASAVIASPSPIRDASAPRFFAGVRARIGRGA
ncbi:MAG TPA: CHAT domain-containing protein, partial [Kofleriaceae bacterium]|nr:CHAT domain-containing protein [Kofleriaceae bacterium]